jgi:ABC-type transporter Mla subunit MlaD
VRDRLQQLKNELQKGEQEMQRLDRQRHEMRDTMLRIAGAIQVLQEFLNDNRPLELEKEAA